MMDFPVVNATDVGPSMMLLLSFSTRKLKLSKIFPRLKSAQLHLELFEVYGEGS